MVTLIICFFLFHMGLSSTANKRILVSDPSYVHQLEVKLQELTSKVKSIATANQQLTNKVDILTNNNQQLQANLDLLNTTVTGLSTGGSGGVYTRWGRTSCPNTTDLVYQGYVGGSWYDHTGAAANHVCMPSEPQYELDALTGTSTAYVYGAEYERLFFGRTTYNDDVPCAVCWSPVKPTVLMIPGRNTCYQGWTHEYNGYLVSGFYNNKAATEYICLDHDPEAVPHGNNNKDGTLLFYVSSVCGSLACPPYIDQKTLSCVVCSK